MHQLLWTNESLFRGAWMMSVPSSGKPFLTTTPQFNNELVRSYGEACGCSGAGPISKAVECLRTTNVSVMVNQSAAWEGSQTNLGGLIRRNVFEEVRSGDWPNVPIILSTTRDEGTAIAFGFNPNSTEVTKQIIDRECITDMRLELLANLSESRAHFWQWYDWQNRVRFYGSYVGRVSQ